MKRYPRAKWPLPAVVNPATSRCITIPVPDDDTHVACFLGALLNLASAAQWADDEAHTARDVALVWRDIIDNLEWGCDNVQTLLRMSGDCAWIEYSLDSGVSWEQLVNIGSCANSAITEAINDGILAPPQQPGSVVRPTPGLCRDFNIELRGNTRWLLPMALSAGDTIEVSGESGAWSDGGLLWQCPDGTRYFLGQCGNPDAGQETDPMPSENHMRLIGHYNDVWFDALDGVYTVPVNVPDSQLYFQCNDSSLSDNQGSIAFKVQICRGAGEWFYTRDWTQVQTLGNWHSVISAGWFADEGGGYWGAAPGNNRVIELYLQWEQPRKVTTVVINYKANNVNVPPWNGIDILNVNARLSGVSEWVSRVTHEISENSNWSGEVTLTLDADEVNYLPIRFEVNGTGTLYIRSITVNGEGGGLPTFI